MTTGAYLCERRIDHSASGARQVFGPVLAATTFVTEEEALRLANDSEFGLGAAVISADEEVTANGINESDHELPEAD